MVGAGWQVFDRDPAVLRWVDAVRGPALAAVDDPDNAGWWRCGGTWFAGVNILDNDGAGRVPGGAAQDGAAQDGPAQDGPALDGPAMVALRRIFGHVTPLDRGQVSVCRPGYPRPSAGESDAAFRFRRDRDAAHVDGLLPVGPDRRRMLREPHAFILGVPLTDTGPGASPLVAWQGSHEIVARLLGAALARWPEASWPDVDLTPAYHAARKLCFETCRRVELPMRPGQACLLHRLCLHGVAPWQEGAAAPPEGRAIAYFRPMLSDAARWPEAAALAIG